MGVTKWALVLIVAGAFSLVLVSCGGGAGNSPTPQPTSAPTITSFAPTSGLVGSSIVITGMNLMGAMAVALNGAAAQYTVNSATQITATVPSGATTGKFTVTTPGGIAGSSAAFTVNAAAPTISSFTPTSGLVGSSVVITGINLMGATAVALNGVAAQYTVNSATQITATVPSGATTGKFTVTTSGGTATSASSFTVNTASTLDLTIDGLYVTQATQDYPATQVPLVQDRSAWVRVFVKANQTNTVAPAVQVQFVNGSTTNTLNIAATLSSVPTSIDPNTNNSWNSAVPSSWIQPGTQVIATVDPTNAIPEADKTNNQFSANLDVRTLKPWKITLVPVHTADGRTATVTSATRTAASWVDFAKRLHPVPDAIDVVVGATMNSTVTLTSDGTGWGTVLSDLSAKRTADGVTDRYYFGAVNVSYTSGMAGLGYIGYPAAIGWDVDGSYPSVLAHEVGHNFGRPHSPCGGASGADPNYPYTGGIIGVPGWDAFATSGNLKNSTSYYDIMGYCSPNWVSDYVYKSVLSFRATSTAGLVVPDVIDPNAPKEGLLVWGRIENGRMVLEPAFRVPTTGITSGPGPYTWEAHDALGNVLASVPFEATEVADLPNTSLQIFSFIVPMNADVMNNVFRVHVSKDGQELVHMQGSGPSPRAAISSGDATVQKLAGRRAQLSWNVQKYPAVMLRDTATGEVRGFLRGGSAMVVDPPVGMEMQFSDGIHAQALRYSGSTQ